MNLFEHIFKISSHLFKLNWKTPSCSRSVHILPPNVWAERNTEWESVPSGQGTRQQQQKQFLFSARFRISSLIPRGISCGGSSDDSRSPYATLVVSALYPSLPPRFDRISITSLSLFVAIPNIMSFHKLAFFIIYLLLISFLSCLPHTSIWEPCSPL